MCGFPSLLSFVKKKGFENRVFEIRAVVKTRRRVLYILYKERHNVIPQAHTREHP